MKHNRQKQGQQEKRPLREDMRLLRRALACVHRFEPAMLPVTVIGAICTAAAPFVNIYFSARILNELTGEKNIQRLIFLAALTVGLNLLLHLSARAAQRGREVISESLMRKEYNSVAAVYLSADYEKLENPEFQNLARDYREATNMRGMVLAGVCQGVDQIVRNLVTVGFSIGMSASMFVAVGGGDAGGSFWQSPYFSLVMLAMVLLVAVASLWLTQTQSAKQFALQSEYIRTNRMFGYYGRMMLDYQQGKEIRVFREQPLIYEEATKAIRDAENTKKISRIAGRYQGAVALLTTLLSGMVYLFVALKAMAGALGVGMVVQYVGAVNQFTTGFTEVAVSFANLRRDTKYMVYYFRFLDTQQQLYRGTLPVEKRIDNQYEIEFKHVSFRYPGSEEWALRDFSIKLRVGERLAVVGRNGSGKTTFIKLLCRLYDPQEGEILLNGIDIKKYDYDEYMSIFSVVFQDFSLFAFPLGQNVACGLEYEADRAQQCLQKAGFDERLQTMPLGLETPLYKDFDEDGVQISGGEAQKIALARALYKNAPFIVLDEPTAALDPVAEYEIYTHFDELAQDKTTVYISHRLSSCRFCHDIAVFDKGRLVQRGDHETLLSQPGIYADLWNAQAQYYTDAGAAQQETQQAYS